jgi:hypothetical protein
MTRKAEDRWWMLVYVVIVAALLVTSWWGWSRNPLLVLLMWATVIGARLSVSRPTSPQ